MAAGTFTLTDQGKLNLLNGTITFTSGIYAILVDNAHTPAVATDSTYANISANECSDVDYAAQDMSGMAITESGGTVKYDADVVSFGASVTISARYIYVLNGTAAGKTGTDKVMGYMDLNDGGAANVSSTASTFSVDWNAANGLLTI